ncbi:VOC family protein [Oceanicola sp. 502str15]|uniref:VOC family protein n=1 Tax=Oceanicola sp. 502str15 TaxID=2696061 RepID=UPI002094A14D|nr:VOC family protein [Oceanicola sp. 502str15]
MTETMTNPADATALPDDALVWCEIPVSDLDAAIAYYGAVLGHPLERNDEGPNPVAMLPVKSPMDGVAGHLYAGKPAGDGTGVTVHLHVPVLEAALERAMEAGGRVLPGIIPIPSGRFAYTIDPDGNSIGLFEYSKG